MEQLTHFTNIQLFAVWVLPVLFALTAHEVSHGYVAYWLGDRTAYLLGRLSFNPIRHVDYIGTILVPLLLMVLQVGVILGWAKPVPINASNFKKPRQGAALVALAGPLANLIMALFWALLSKLGWYALRNSLPGGLAVYVMGLAGININIWLMLLNLLPIPPLDGSIIVTGILPKRVARYYYMMAPFGFIILLGLLYLGVINRVLEPLAKQLLGVLVGYFALYS